MHAREQRPRSKRRAFTEPWVQEQPVAGGAGTGAIVRGPRRWWREIAGARTFESLHVSAYRWFFFAMLGQMASAFMQQVVRGYLVYVLTGSYAALGSIALANAVPGLVLSLHAGTLADRVREKKYVVQAGQLGSAAIALWLAIMLVLGQLRFEHLFIGSVLQGAVQALMMPARQAMIPEVVGPRRLMNAVALTSAGQNSIRSLAPALGGFMLAMFAPRWVYFAMTGCYLAAALFLLPVPKTQQQRASLVAEGEVQSDEERSRSQRTGHGGVIDGIRYVVKDPVLRPVLGVNVLLVLTSMPYLFLLPGFVSGELHGGPGLLGGLYSAVGVGALGFALVVASLPDRHRGLYFLLTSALQGVMLMAFSASRVVWLTVPIMVVMGMGQAGRQSFGNVLVQYYSADEYRGRVMSVYMLQFSLTSLGTFFVGLLANVIGASWALGGAAALMVAVVVYCLAFLPSLRGLD